MKSSPAKTPTRILLRERRNRRATAKAMVWRHWTAFDMLLLMKWRARAVAK